MDEFNRNWITENAIEICARYDRGILTLRGLHYQLVSLGMTNSIQHYKRVVSAMIKARREGIIPYYQFSDHDREKIGRTKWRETDLEDMIRQGKEQIKLWMTSYAKNRWENQESYVEIWIEKKALQGVFQPVAKEKEVALCPCKGYPSLTFLYEASVRFEEVINESDKDIIIVYFGDHDPSGEDIPRSIQENFAKDFGVMVNVDVIALLEQQCLDLDLPAAPAKLTDSRTARFDGLGQIELDAVKPEMLQDWAKDACDKYFSESAFAELEEQEDDERETYIEELKEFAEGL